MRPSRWTLTYLALALPAGAFVAVLAKNRQTQLRSVPSSTARPAAIVPPQPQPTSVTATDAQVTQSNPPSGPSPRCAVTEPETDPHDALGVRVRSVTARGALTPRLDYGGAYAVWLRVRDAESAASAAATVSPLELTVSTRAALSVRDPLALTLTARNAQRAPFVLAHSMDGSFEHMREPFVDLYLQRLSDNAIYRYSAVGSRCGMVNPVGTDDLQTLAQGEQSTSPFSAWAQHLHDAHVPVAGRYRLWVVYRVCDQARLRGMSEGFTVPPQLLLDRVRSNSIELAVQ